MELITEPSEFPDVLFHTVTVEEEEDGDYFVAASDNENHCIATVGSVAISGDGTVGVNNGSFSLDAADGGMRIKYLNFENEYGYDEIQIDIEARAE